MVQFFMILVIGAGVGGYLYYIKKSGKLGAMQQNYVDAQNEVDNNFDTLYQNLKNDPETFGPIKSIVESDFISIANCKNRKKL